MVRRTAPLRAQHRRRPRQPRAQPNRGAPCPGDVRPLRESTGRIIGARGLAERAGLPHQERQVVEFSERHHRATQPRLPRRDLLSRQLVSRSARAADPPRAFRPCAGHPRRALRGPLTASVKPCRVPADRPDTLRALRPSVCRDSSTRALGTVHVLHLLYTGTLRHQALCE